MRFFLPEMTPVNDNWGNFYDNIQNLGCGKSHTCCWKERVVLGQTAWRARMLGCWELKKSCARRVAPEMNLEPEGKSRRAWNLERSRNSFWKFPCWAVNDRVPNRSARKVDFTPGPWKLKTLKLWKSSCNWALLELSPNAAVTAAPVCEKVNFNYQLAWISHINLRWSQVSIIRVPTFIN